VTDPRNGPPKPEKATIENFISVLTEATRHPRAKACFLFPLAVFVFVFIVARMLAPEFSTRTDGDYSAVFSTAAQLIVTLLVALALELRASPFGEPNAARLVVGVTLVYVALGAAAAVLALIPGLDSTLYQWLFALTLAAGGSALLSVLMISYQVLEDEAMERRRRARQG
jgi:hypothetical protein